MKTALVILAGGFGSRLWPLSRKKFPKQFTSIINEKSLLRNTFERVQEIVDLKNVFISTNFEYANKTLSEIPELSLDNLILEPNDSGRLAAFGLVAIQLKERGFETVITMASDEYIEDIEIFHNVLHTGIHVNKQHPESFLIIGMNPTYASTGYGYMEISDTFYQDENFRVCNVVHFKEKPHISVARFWSSQRNYLWNSGIYIFSPNSLVQEIKRLEHETITNLEKIVKANIKDIPEEVCSSIKCAPFETTVLNKMEHVVTIPVDIGWADLGSWKSIRRHFLRTRKDTNYFKGNVIAHKTSKTLVYSTNKKKLISLAGLENIIVVDTEDSLLIMKANESENIKEILKEVPEEFK